MAGQPGCAEAAGWTVVPRGRKASSGLYAQFQNSGQGAERWRVFHSFSGLPTLCQDQSSWALPFSLLLIGQESHLSYNIQTQSHPLALRVSLLWPVWLSPHAPILSGARPGPHALVTGSLMWWLICHLHVLRPRGLLTSQIPESGLSQPQPGIHHLWTQCLNTNHHQDIQVSHLS